MMKESFSTHKETKHKWKTPKRCLPHFRSIGSGAFAEDPSHQTRTGTTFHLCPASICTGPGLMTTIMRARPILPIENHQRDRMSSLAISGIAFAFVFGGALTGMFLRAKLPKEQLTPEARDVVKLAMGTVATMSAVVLGLLVSSAKTYYDTENRELMEMSTKIVLLDRILAHYGPDAKQARDSLRTSVVGLLDRVWGKGSARSLSSVTGEADVIYDTIQALSPHDDIQRSLQGRALSVAIDVGQTRFLMTEQGSATVSIPLLLVVVFS